MFDTDAGVTSVLTDDEALAHAHPVGPQHVHSVRGSSPTRPAPRFSRTAPAGPAARAAAPGGTFVLNARTDTYFAGTSGDAFADTVDRAGRYLEAGADCVFVPGVVEEGTIRRLAAAIPGPLNVVAGLANTIDAPRLFPLGVKRVSLGGSLARAALSMLERAGRELLDTGTLGFLDGAIAYADLPQRFSP
jgi:2-methylisocitrate lyase-like PEP mutase family enzyme